LLSFQNSGWANVIQSPRRGTVGLISIPPRVCSYRRWSPGWQLAELEQLFKELARKLAALSLGGEKCPSKFVQKVSSVPQWGERR